MLLRCTRRVKDGKSHGYWNVVENRRLSDGRVVQRQVLYLGQINASQREAWRKTIELNLQTAVDRLNTAGNRHEHEASWPRRGSPFG